MASPLLSILKQRAAISVRPMQPLQSGERNIMSNRVESRNWLRNLKNSPLLLLLALLPYLFFCPGLALADDQFTAGSFQLAPFSNQQIDDGQMRKQIQVLLQNDSKCRNSNVDCNNPIRNEAILKRAHTLQERLQKIVGTAIAKGGRISYQDSWHTDGPFGIPSREYHEVRFASLIQRPGNHPSNQVVFKYITPLRRHCNCDLKTVMVISGANDGSMGDVAGMAQTMSELNQLATLTLYLPHFGPRRFLPDGHRDPLGSHLKYDPGEVNVDYFDLNDVDATRENMVQSILDMHMAMDWLKAIKRNPAPSSVALFGISLGSVISFLYEGLEPGRMTGGDAFYAPGGDIAHAIASELVNSKYVHDFFTSAGKNANWQEDHSRFAMAEADPLIWTGQIRNRDFFFVDAEYDDTFIRDYSYTPFFNALKVQNQIEEDWLPTHHDLTDEVGYVYLGLHLFWPMMDFLRLHGISADPEHCGPLSHR
jgi:hypothetical protein